MAIELHCTVFLPLILNRQFLSNLTICLNFCKWIFLSIGYIEIFILIKLQLIGGG